MEWGAPCWDVSNHSDDHNQAGDQDLSLDAPKNSALANPGELFPAVTEMISEVGTGTSTDTG